MMPDIALQCRRITDPAVRLLILYQIHSRVCSHSIRRRLETKKAAPGQERLWFANEIVED